MNNKSKEIENELNNVIELLLHLDKNILKINKKEEQLKLSKNSKDIIKEFLESKKVVDFLCNDEEIKKHRNSNGILKAINLMLNKNKLNKKTITKAKQVNPTSFNQISLVSNLFYYGIEAEFYFCHNILKSKILSIVKECFENKYIKNEKESTKNNNKDNKNNFIIISNNNLQKVKLKKRYFRSFINKSNNNILSMKDYYIKSNISNFYDNKNNSNNNNSGITMFDNSKKKKIIFKNNSCINLMNTFMNKNSSSTNEKFISTNLKHTVDNSKESWKNKNIIHRKRNITFLNKNNINEFGNPFLPILYFHNSKYKNEFKFKPKKIPSFSSGMMELIHYNTKNNIKEKAEEEFLKELQREIYPSLRNININTLYNSKCFVDYSKNNIIKDNDDIFVRKNDEVKELKEKKLFYRFEYKNVYKYSFDGRLSRDKK